MNENESMRGLSEWVKKALSSGGVGLESIASMVAQAGDVRRDMTHLLVRELKNILSNATIEVNAKIRFVPNDEQAEKKKPAPKRRARKKKPSP